jgi:hypothetical protein
MIQPFLLHPHRHRRLSQQNQKCQNSVTIHRQSLDLWLGNHHHLRLLHHRHPNLPMLLLMLNLQNLHDRRRLQSELKFQQMMNCFHLIRQLSFR